MKYYRIKKEYFEHKNIVEENYVFLTKFGKKYTNDIAQRDIKRIAKNAGVATSDRASPHTFRYFFTQSLLKNGTDIYTIQRLLGHASNKTTEIYLNSLVNNVVLEKGLVSSPLMNL